MILSESDEGKNIINNISFHCYQLTQFFVECRKVCEIGNKSRSVCLIQYLVVVEEPWLVS